MSDQRRLALILGGGAALGAFQGGVWQALEERGLVPERLAGTSIGALNATLIAGSPPQRRLERLRAFWDLVAVPASPPGGWSGSTRRMLKTATALRGRLLGRPGLYQPTLPRLLLDAPPGSPSLYDLSPALATLERLVDFARVAEGDPRLAINLTDLETGHSIVIDSASEPVRAEHVIASMALLPDMAPVEIDGRLMCDGGFSANLPLHAVLDPPPEEDLLCLAVDLLGEPGRPILSLDGMMERSSDLLFANQTRCALATLEARFAHRSTGGRVTLVLLACDGRGERISQKTWDFGRRSLAERWRAGHRATLDAIARLDDLAPPPPGGLAVHRLAVPSALPG
jgi:NTE family protein